MIKDNSLQIASLKLLHTVKNTCNDRTVPFSKLVKYGIVPVSNSGIVEEIDAELADLIISTLGIKPVEWASSFHKSWDKVATASIEQLVAEQIVHYFSTYGMESIGFNSVNYIPIEKILINLDRALSIEAFTVVHVLTDDEFKHEIINYIYNVSAPHKDSISYITCLLQYVNDIDVDSIKSFEVKTIYCDIHNVAPSDSQNFLRLAIYKASNGNITSIVKDKKTIELLKYFSTKLIAESMLEHADLAKLSESFFRFKPLFLAFKNNKHLANKINKIRRLANTNHKPVTGFTVSNLMNLLALDKKNDAVKIIEKANIRELVKLINFARYETVAKDHIYSIRNGKLFIKIEDENNNINVVRLTNLLWLNDVCTNQLRSALNNFYSGKVFYIPNCIEYVAPVSEKQMSDVLPYGTRVNLPKDANAICIGGHWFNNDTQRIDLDFHLNSINGSFGWNSNYRSAENDILFSGDMTDAPKPYGAVEAFRISSKVKDAYILSVNIYNTSIEVPFDLLFTKDVTNECNFKSKSKDMVSTVINPKNAIAPKLNLKVHEREEVIGFYKDKSFIVYGGDICGGHRIPNKQFMQNVLNASLAKCDSMMTMREFIELAGGKVTSEISKEISVDLSPSKLTSTTLFGVLELH